MMAICQECEDDPCMCPPSPTQGEKPAEAQANLTPEDRASMFIDWCALHGFGLQGWPDGAHAQLVGHMKGCIEALQRQMAETERELVEQVAIAQRHLADFEAAEFSLRTLGDALERARKDAVNAVHYCTSLDENGYICEKADAITAIMRALTPPTLEPATPRDTDGGG